MVPEPSPVAPSAAALECTEHAQRQMRWRGIPEAFVHQIMAAPQSTQRRADGRTAYGYRILDEQGDWYRYVHVVADDGPPQLVITVYERSGRG